MMSTAWVKELEAQAGILVQTFRSVSGGDIADAYYLETSKGDRFFLKMQAQPNAHLMFAVEKAGLGALGQHPSIRIPQVLGLFQLSDRAALLMEYIEAKRPGPQEWQLFGRSLAELHCQVQGYFGWTQDNFIGRLPQSNRRHDSWITFYAQERLLSQLERAKTQGLLKGTECPDLATLQDRLDPYLAEVQPSLLHGDLWSGNFLFDQEGRPCLIDPATYYGHHEVDLAMSRLFGGFHTLFYEAYAEIMPEQLGAGARHDLYQLYYLLVHLNLFGRSYYTSVKKLLERYFS